MSEIVQFPDRSDRWFNRATLDELTEIIGFRTGSLALHRAGFETVGAVANADVARIQAVRGIGREKLRRIADYFKANGLPAPCRRRQPRPEQLEMKLPIRDQAAA